MLLEQFAVKVCRMEKRHRCTALTLYNMRDERVVLVVERFNVQADRIE